MKAKLARFVPPLWVIYIFIALALLSFVLCLPHSEAFLPTHLIAEPATATLQILQEIMKLVLSLNTALLAGAGALVVKGREWGLRWGKMESLLMISVFLCGVASYFGVYSCQVQILTMVNSGVLNPLETGLIWSLRLQYSGLIGGVLLLGLAFAIALERSDEESADGRFDKVEAKPARRARRPRP